MHVTEPLKARTSEARKLTRLIKKGPPEALAAALAGDPSLAIARVDDGKCVRSTLHLVTDWPGKREHAAAAIKLLVDSGCDPNVRAIGPHGETPLHWAASCDDVPAIRALVDAGADLEMDGAVIGGLTAMADAVAFGQWNAAECLLELGANVTFWQAAGLGRVELLEAEVDDHDQADLTHALWVAASSGRRETAEFLLAHGADPGVVGIDDLTPREAAQRSGYTELATWLDQLGRTIQ